MIEKRNGLWEMKCLMEEKEKRKQLMGKREQHEREETLDRGID